MRLKDILSFEDESDIDKSVEFKFMVDKIYLEVEDPWMADSEVGLHLNVSQVQQLHIRIAQWLDEIRVNAVLNGKEFAEKMKAIKTMVEQVKHYADL